MSKKKVFFKTFGCRTNIFDTAIMQENIKNHSICSSEEEAEIIVINSCTVTNRADSTIKSYINRYGEKEILFTGCGVKTVGEELYKKGEIKSLFAHSKKELIDSIISSEKRVFDIDGWAKDNTIITNFESKSRAFIKIQEGCSFDCSFCIIPSVRGEARSVKKELILKQAEALVQNGFSEFVLTGTNTGSYGVDTNSTLSSLIKDIADIRGVKRIRLGSLEPSQIDEALLELIGEDFFSKHLHIAIQHSDDYMLELMSRRNRVKDDIALFEKIASLNVCIGTDYIVGHPGESQDIWSRAFENFKNYPLTHIHPFTYSKKSGTKSASMIEEVEIKKAKERLEQITEVVKRNNYNFRLNNKESLKVLVERGAKNQSGLDQFFNRVEVVSSRDFRGEWIEIKECEIEHEKSVAKI